MNHAFAVTFEQFNASLLNKRLHYFFFKLHLVYLHALLHEDETYSINM